MPVVSIVIPAFAVEAAQVHRFQRLMNSLLEQTYKDFEIVVADHSPESLIKNVCSTYTCNIRYFRNSRQFGNSSANTNFGLSQARGEVIKVMHADDFFIQDTALELMVNELRRLPRVKWGVFAFDHLSETDGSVFNSILPSVHRTLGCPSTTFFKSNSDHRLLFDESLIFINDHDFHQRLIWEFGPPLVIRDCSIRIGIHPGQVSQMLGDDRLTAERRYFETKTALIIRNHMRHKQYALNRQSKLD